MIDVDINNDLVFIGIPLERFALPEFIQNRDEIQARLQSAGLGVQIYQASGHRVDRNRDKIVRAFLDHPKKPDWLLMLDSDMLHPVDVGFRLIGHRVPVVGALYFHRSTHDPLVFMKDKEREDEWGRQTLMWTFMREEVYSFLASSGLPNRDDAFALSAPGNPLLECDAVGTGCMIIHRNILEAMTPPWFEYTVQSRSEDIHFCYRVREELDTPVYADMSTICGHYNLVPMGQAQFRRKFAARGVTATNYTPDEAVEWLEKFAGFQDADSAMANYHQGQLAEIWDKAVKDGLSDLEFYQIPEVGRTYLMDLLWWNASPLFGTFRNQLIGSDDRKVLEIGSGIGTIATQLALQGCDVTAVEPNGILRDFARKRFKWTVDNKAMSKPGKVSFVDRFKRGRPRDDKFDLAVAIDVLEHMDVDTLTNTMSMLSNNLRQGGRLFYHNNWGQQDVYPMHHDHSGIWDELVDKYGFIKTGDLWLTKT